MKIRAAIIGLSVGLLSSHSLSGCAIEQLWNPPSRVPGTGGPIVSSQVKEPAPLAPWDIWDAAVLGDPVFTEADREVAGGRLEAGLRIYEEIEAHAISSEIRTRALMRRLSTMLKLGRSRAVLDEVSKTLKAQGKAVSETDPTLALYAGYAYLHMKDEAQALVWFSLARSRVNERGVIARRSVTEATRLVMSVQQDMLNKLETGVANDPFLLNLVKEEQARRSQGGRMEANPIVAWFNPATYAPGGTATNLAGTPEKTVPETPAGSLNLSAAGDRPVLGVLLPSSGKYAAHSNLVKQGIDLAIQDAPNGDKVRVVYGDTQGSAEAAGAEFDRLIQQEGVSLVLGPMLVKDAEEVAKRSDATGIPFLTFTKRPGITDLSRVGFRLGATAENQTDELVSYVSDQLHKKNFAMISPRTAANSEDFTEAFRASVRRSGGNLVKDVSYVSGNASSVKAAVESLGSDAGAIDAIFVPDAALERASTVLDAIRSSAFRPALILGPASWNETVAVHGYAPLLETAVIASPFFRDSQRPEVTRFVQEYKAKYNRPPDVLTAQAYDATSLVLAAISKLPNAVPPVERSGAIAKQLHELQPQDAVTGKLSVSPNGEISRQMSILRMQGGELVEVMAAGQMRAIYNPGEPQRTVLTEPRNLPLGAPQIPASISKDR